MDGIFIYIGVIFGQMLVNISYMEHMGNITKDLTRILNHFDKRSGQTLHQQFAPENGPFSLLIYGTWRWCLFPDPRFISGVSMNGRPIAGWLSIGGFPQGYPTDHHPFLDQISPWNTPSSGWGDPTSWKPTFFSLSSTVGMENRPSSNVAMPRRPCHHPGNSGGVQPCDFPRLIVRRLLENGLQVADVLFQSNILIKLNIGNQHPSIANSSNSWPMVTPWQFLQSMPGGWSILITHHHKLVHDAHG